MEYVTEEIGRVMGSQIYIYNSPDEIPALPPKGVNDVFIDINLGKVYQWDGTEWKYKFPIPNDSRIVDIVDELTALGARLEDEESARVVAENARVGAEQSRVAAETERKGNEAARQSNETSRQGAESVRASSETSRNDAESLREEAEGARQTAEANRAVAEGARSDAEASRASAETARATAESGRVSAEQSRVSAEQSRATAEGQRATAETARANAESARASAETARQTNESTRQSNESTRQSQEGARQTAEGVRASAEQTRAQKEVARQVAESNREDAESLRVQAENTRAANDELWNEHEQTRQANEAQRVLAEQARVNAEAGRQAELDSKITYGSGWFDGSGGVHYSEESDLADNIKTNEGSSVVDAVAQFDPISQAVEDGSYAKMDNMKGRSFAYNQLSYELNDTYFGFSGALGTISNGIATFTVSAKYGGLLTKSTYRNQKIISGHIYLVCANVKSAVATTEVYLRIEYSSGGVGGQNYRINNTTDWQFVCGLHAGSSNSSDGFVYLFDNRNSDWSEIQAKAFQLFDLTAMGISATTVDEAIAALRSYGIEPTIYNGHSAGKIIDSKPNKIISRGVNLWDEVTDVGSINNEGEEVTGPYLRSKNFIPIVPGSTIYVKRPSYTFWLYFYDANKNLIDLEVPSGGGTVPYKPMYITTPNSYTVPSNARYMKFLVDTYYGTTYNHDITIAKGTTDPGYHAFVKDEHDLVLPVMRSAGNAADDKDLIRIGTYTFTGNETWTQNGNCYQTQAGLLPNVKTVPSTELSNVLNGKLPTKIASSLYDGTNASGIAVDQNGKITIGGSDYSNVSNLTGSVLNYELATPVPQDPAISLPQNIKVWNVGSLETQYESPNTTPGLISLTYQANVKNFVVGTAKREDINWNPNNIVSQEQLQEGLAPKADTKKIESGGIISRLAHDLTPYSDDSGAFQDNPMISQGTGTDNNTAIVTTGNYAQLREKQGNTLAVVQLRNPLHTPETQTISGVTFTNKGDGGIHVQGTATANLTLALTSAFPLFNAVAGHKYYVMGGSAKVTLTIQTNGAFDYWQTLNAPKVITAQRTGVAGSSNLGVSNGEVVDEDVYIKIIDITSWPSDVIADLTANPSHFSWYYNGSLAYDAGSLKNANGVKLVCTKRNLFNGESEQGMWDVGGKVNATTRARAKELVQVIPNKAYHYYDSSSTRSYMNFTFYDANMNLIENISVQKGHQFNAPSNARWVGMFTLQETSGIQSFGSNITISLYYTPEEGGEGYDQHYDYVEPNVVDTGSEVLRSAGSVHDVKLPDGTIQRNIIAYKMKDLEWVGQTEGVYYANLTEDASNKNQVQEICNRYGISRLVYNSADRPDKTIGIREAYSVKRVYVLDSSYPTVQLFTASLTDNDYFYCERETPTTEQGTPFPENIDIDDYGMMYWLDEDDELVGIPQGAKFFYPVNYKGFTDDLYNRTEGDAGELVLQSELSASETARDAVDAQLKEALGGTLRQLLAVKETLDFNDTDYIDLGDVNFAKYTIGSIVIFAGQNPKINMDTTAYSTKVLNTKYKMVASIAGSMSDKTFNINNAYFGSNYIAIRDDDYANLQDGPAFKAAMKNVLLAYKKA